MQPTRDQIPTVWLKPDSVLDVLRYLKLQVDRPYQLLYDLTAIDERVPHASEAISRRPISQSSTICSHSSGTQTFA